MEQINLKLVSIIIIAWTVFFDAIRDRWMSKFRGDDGWMKRHIAKWLAFYPIIGYIIYENKLYSDPWISIPIMIVGGWAIWQLGQFASGGGPPWRSYWLGLIWGGVKWIASKIKGKSPA